MAKKRSKPDVHKQSLIEQIEDPASAGVRATPRTKKVRGSGGEEDVEAAMTATVSRRVLSMAKEQQEELSRPQVPAAAALAAELEASSDEEDAEAGWDAAGNDYEGRWEEEEEILPEDEAALAAFMNPAGAQPQRTLADIINEKLRDMEEQKAIKEAAAVPKTAMETKMEEVFRGVGRLLSRYTSGKIPRAFKIIPTLREWEQALFLTAPEHWTPHATFAATRLFVSNLNDRLAQRYLALVLLPAVRNDVAENKRLHFALFQALKKATYKPAAFFKGVLLPLCASGNCSLREAVIVSSVLKRCSLPVLHSAAALLRLAEMPYSGTTSFFIRVLLDKRYALPYRVVDALVDHFVRFRSDERALPVVWHQALLCFVQRYKNEIREEDRAELHGLLRAQFHHLVTPEIRRELEAGVARGVRAPASAALKEGGKEDPKALAPLVFVDDLS